MDILFYKEGDAPSSWLSQLSSLLPDAKPRVWQTGDNDRADYVLAWNAPPEVLRHRTGLKAVFTLSAGVDWLLRLLEREPDLIPAQVPVIKLDDAGMGIQMAQYVGAAVLRHFRRFDEYAHQQSMGRWQPLPPRSAQSCPVGVMGMGALGSKVATSLQALGFTMRGWSNHPKQIEGVQHFAGRQQLPEFLDGLKVLVNLLPLTPETENILDAELFSRLAQGAQLVNVARGAHLVEQDLLDALASRQLDCATLDVFRQEPLPAEHPFWGHPRIEITPHVSAMTLQTESLMQIAARIEQIEKGLTVAGVIDRNQAY